MQLKPMPERVANFANLRRALICDGEPEFVPMVEFGIADDVKAAFFGRAAMSLRNEVLFRFRQGYPTAAQPCPG
jgi:hypothetical protein